jgi:hypothetical protein
VIVMISTMEEYFRDFDSKYGDSKTTTTTTTTTLKPPLTVEATHEKSLDKIRRSGL